MRISGDVHFGGSVFNPTSSGQFNVVSGTFKYLSHTFDITKGTATFTSGTYLPMLQLDAETNVGTYNIYLGVKGTVDHMDLKMCIRDSSICIKLFFINSTLLIDYLKRGRYD